MQVGARGAVISAATDAGLFDDLDHAVKTVAYFEVTVQPDEARTTPCSAAIGVGAGRSTSSIVSARSPMTDQLEPSMPSGPTRATSMAVISVRPASPHPR